MKLFKRTAAVWLSILAILTFSAFAQSPGRDTAKEEKNYEALKKISPESVEKFKAATEALDQEKFDDSYKLYDEVLKKAPNFSPALRRAGTSLVHTGKRNDGLALTQKAVDLERSPENLISLASDLVEPGSINYKATKEEIKKASVLAAEAMKKSPDTDDPSYALLTADLALSAENLDGFNSSVATLKENSRIILRRIISSESKRRTKETFRPPKRKSKNPKNSECPPKPHSRCSD